MWENYKGREPNPSSFRIIIIKSCLTPKHLCIYKYHQMRYKKTIRSTCQIVIAVIVILLAVSTFIPQRWVDYPESYPTGQSGSIISTLRLDRFYNSPVNLILWVLLIVLLIIGVITGGIPRNPYKVIHFLLAAIFLVVIYDKTTNQRFMLSIAEGETVNFSWYVGADEPEYKISLTLDRFEIKRHPGSEMPSSFKSYLIINHSDSARIAVNEPLAVGRYRLYQSSYDQNYLFRVFCDSDTADVSFGDSVLICGDALKLRSYDHKVHQFKIEMGGREYGLPPGRVSMVAGRQMSIHPVGEVFVSTIEVAEITGTKLLLILAMMYLAGLGYSFWGRNK
jgi:hypothetical protein